LDFGLSKGGKFGKRGEEGRGILCLVVSVDLKNWRDEWIGGYLGKCEERVEGVRGWYLGIGGMDGVWDRERW
jgi:hypothetical protein